MAFRPSPSSAGARTGEGFRTRALLKVQDGCDAFCAYCIVPYARGVPRAVPLGELADEAKALVAAGAREIVLTGINIGRYSDGEATLADVVGAVAASGVERLRLSSIEPLDLTPAFLEVLARTASFCPHLHVPLQSGSDAVLSAMGRRYSAAEYAERIAEARSALPGLAVTTDVLCGFPGESDEDAEQTLLFCDSLGFSWLHVFRYSARPGTPAAAMPAQVPHTVTAARAGRLRACAERLACRARRAAPWRLRQCARRDGGSGRGRPRDDRGLPSRVGSGCGVAAREHPQGAPGGRRGRGVDGRARAGRVIESAVRLRLFHAAGPTPANRS